MNRYKRFKLPGNINMARKEIEEFRRSIRRNEEKLELHKDTIATTKDLQRLKKDIKCNEEKITLQKQMIASLSGKIRKIKERNAREEKLMDIIETIDEEGDVPDDSLRKIKEIILIQEKIDATDEALSKLQPQNTILKKVSATSKKTHKGNRVKINETSEIINEKKTISSCSNNSRLAAERGSNCSNSSRLAAERSSSCSNNSRLAAKRGSSCGNSSQLAAERDRLRSMYGDINCDVFVNINDSCRQISNESYDQCKGEYDPNIPVKDCNKNKLVYDQNIPRKDHNNIKAAKIVEMDSSSDNEGKEPIVEMCIKDSNQNAEINCDEFEGKKKARSEREVKHGEQSKTKKENVNNDGLMKDERNIVFEQCKIDVLNI